MSLFAIKNSSTPSSILNNESTVYSVEVEEDKVVILERIPSNSVALSVPPQPIPDSVVKHIFTVKNNKIILEKTVTGIITPEKVTVESEQVVFNENNS